MIWLVLVLNLLPNGLSWAHDSKMLHFWLKKPTQRESFRNKPSSNILVLEERHVYLETMSQVMTGLFQHQEDVTIKEEHMFPQGFLIICIMSDLAMRFPSGCFQIWKNRICCRNSQTHQAVSVHQKKGWLHLPAVSRGLADSQHSLCATTPSPEGTQPVLSHLSVRATREHPTLKEFIAGSHIHLKTCICGPDTQSSCMGPV